MVEKFREGAGGIRGTSLTAGGGGLKDGISKDIGVMKSCGTSSDAGTITPLLPPL